MRRMGVALVLCAGLTLGVRAAPLVTNGTFEGGFVALPPSGPLDGAADFVPIGWSRVETFSGGIIENSLIAAAQDNGPTFPGFFATDFVRMIPPNGSGDWTAIEQPLAVDATGLGALALTIDVKVFSHNLPAGGWVAPAFEWPAICQIDFVDIFGVPQTWRHGWFLSNPGDVPGPINDPGSGSIPIYRDLVVPQGIWVANTFNLLAELPNVATITNLRVGGSGWNFESRIDNVAITAVPIPEPSTLALLAGGLWLFRRRR